MKSLRHGFTLIELLVVVAIIGLLTGIGIASYNNFNEKQQVQQAAMSFATMLRTVQKRVNSGERPTGCTGVLQNYVVSTTLNNTNASIIITCLDVPAIPPIIEQFDLGKNAVFSSAENFIFKPLNKGLDSLTKVEIVGVNSTVKYNITAEMAGVITVTEQP